eukprot:13333978-Alexandrium_andersonii.AAC.1
MKNPLNAACSLNLWVEACDASAPRPAMRLPRGRVQPELADGPPSCDASAPRPCATVAWAR